MDSEGVGVLGGEFLCSVSSWQGGQVSLGSKTKVGVAYVIVFLEPGTELSGLECPHVPPEPHFPVCKMGTEWFCIAGHVRIR